MRTCGLVSSTGFSHTSRAGHKGASGARCLLIKPSSKTLRALRRKLEGKPEQKAPVRRGKVAFCCQNRRDGLSAPKHHPRRLFQFSALIAAGRQQQQRQKKCFIVTSSDARVLHFSLPKMRPSTVSTVATIARNHRSQASREPSRLSGTPATQYVAKVSCIHSASEACLPALLLSLVQ
jgi:hypothetical protein